MRAAMRRTLAGETSPVVGLGLFTEAESRVTIAPGDAGLVFVVAGQRISATAANLSEEAVVPAFADMPARHTVLAAGGAQDTARVITVEHVLAALVGTGITDAEISIECDDGSRAEIPIDDGSARVFVEAIKSAGVTEIGPASPLVIMTEVVVNDGAGGMIVAEPAAVPDFSYLLDYASQAGDDAAVASQKLPKQTARWSGDEATFDDAIAPARTFSFKDEAEQMQQLGLFTSFTPADLLVLGEGGEPIDNELRFDNEPARHKLLDLIGDLALVGRPIIGRVAAYRSGHALNHEMARQLAALV